MASSNGKGGATSVASPTPEDVAALDRYEAEAVAQISAVENPAEAEKLLGKVSTIVEAMRWNEVAGDRERRWRVIRLRAERRYGELLPPKRTGQAHRPATC